MWLVWTSSCRRAVFLGWPLLRAMSDLSSYLFLTLPVESHSKAAEFMAKFPCKGCAATEAAEPTNDEQTFATTGVPGYPTSAAGDSAEKEIEATPATGKAKRKQKGKGFATSKCRRKATTKETTQAEVEEKSLEPKLGQVDLGATTQAKVEEKNLAPELEEVRLEATRQAEEQETSLEPELEEVRLEATRQAEEEETSLEPQLEEVDIEASLAQLFSDEEATNDCIATQQELQLVPRDTPAADPAPGPVVAKATLRLNALLRAKPEVFECKSAEEVATLGEWFEANSDRLSELPYAAFPSPLHNHGAMSYTLKIAGNSVTVRVTKAMFYVKDAKEFSSEWGYPRDSKGGVCVTWRRAGCLYAWMYARLFAGEPDGLPEHPHLI